MIFAATDYFGEPGREFGLRDWTVIARDELEARRVLWHLRRAKPCGFDPSGTSLGPKQGAFVDGRDLHFEQLRLTRETR